jgi:UrcA family protein
MRRLSAGAFRKYSERVSKRFRSLPKSFMRAGAILCPIAASGGAHNQPAGDHMNNSMTRILAILSLTAACTAVGAQAAAAAADPGGEPSVRIDTHRLDLTKPGTVASLYARIQSSARKVCRDSASSSDRAPLSAFERCYNATVEHAVQSVHVPLLTALHQQATRMGIVAQTKK